MTELVWLVALLPLVSGELIIYPHADGAPRSNKFQIFLTQDGTPRKESFVYISSSDLRAAEDSRRVFAGRTMSWTSFAFTGSEVTVEVRAPRDFTNCIVRPKSYDIQCRRAGEKTAEFDVPSNRKMMSVEFDYDYGNTGRRDITDKLMVFADPPETHTPNKNDPNVLYYDVGVHMLNGQLDIGAKTEVYLAPGAFVSGGFFASRDHPVKIHGRGIIHIKDFAWKDNRFQMAAITLDKGSGHTVEGVTISDSMWFFIRALSPRVTIRNVKTVGAWLYNTDGIVTGNNGVIEDCFFHANDDAIKLYNSGMNVSRCVIWQAQNGAVFQTGWNARRHMQGVRVTDIDIIHIDWCAFKGDNCDLTPNKAVFDQNGNTNTFDISDIELKDIRVEGRCPRIIYWKMLGRARGTATNIRFINWNLESQPHNGPTFHNEIAGSRSTGRVTNWQFVNFTIGDRCVTNASQADFRIDARTTQNIGFQCRRVAG